MSEWNDIDTVPKDGRTVFLSDGKTVVAAHWHESPANRFRCAVFGWVLAGGDDMCGALDLISTSYYDWFAPECDFTHWMPMLDLPIDSVN